MQRSTGLKKEVDVSLPVIKLILSWLIAVCWDLHYFDIEVDVLGRRIPGSDSDFGFRMSED